MSPTELDPLRASPGSLGAALILAAAYALGPRLVPWERRHPRRWLSMAAGASMAYVFLGVLPELGARHRQFLERAGAVAFAGRRIYVVALAGFIFLYALDQMLLFWVYVTAMFLHLLVVSNALSREHGRLYHDRGRWALAASVVAGWCSAALAPLPEDTMARLFAFVAGGVIMTSANEELPREKGGKFGWFALGAAVYGGVLLLA